MLDVPQNDYRAHTHEREREGSVSRITPKSLLPIALVPDVSIIPQK